MNRYRASAIHLAVSFAVACSLFAVFWFLIYPSPMLTAIGGHEIFLLILGIDVVLGPLLTLVVFDTRKKSLKFDLAFIATAQIAALVYGVSVLYEGRPAYIASLGDHFQVVLSTEVTDANLKKANTRLPKFGPKLVGTTDPVDRYDVDAVDLVKQVGGGKGHFPQLHVPYETTARSLPSKSFSIAELKKMNPGRTQDIDVWLRSRQRTATDTVYQVIKIRASEFAIALDGETGQVIGITPFAP